jgi:hypothetical protein
MRGEPYGAKEENHAKKEFRGHGAGAWQRRFDGGDGERGADQDDHGAKRHGDDQKHGENREKNVFHGAIRRTAGKHSAIERKSVCTETVEWGTAGGLAESGPVVGDKDGIARVRRIVLDAGLLAGHEPIETDLTF